MENKELLECLQGVGVDIEGSLERFMGNESLYVRFLHKFPEDPNFEEMERNMQDGDREALLKSSHALKGLTGNLGLNYMYERLSTMVSDLREGRYDRLDSLLAELQQNYREVCDLLSQ